MAVLSASILFGVPPCCIEPVLSSTSATRSRVLPQVAVELATIGILWLANGRTFKIVISTELVADTITCETFLGALTLTTGGAASDGILPESDRVWS